MKELTAREAALNWLYDWMSGFDERFMIREADSLEKLLIERDKGKWISVEDELPPYKLSLLCWRPIDHKERPYYKSMI